MTPWKKKIAGCSESDIHYTRVFDIRNYISYFINIFCDIVLRQTQIGSIFRVWCLHILKKKISQIKMTSIVRFLRPNIIRQSAALMKVSGIARSGVESRLELHSTFRTLFTNTSILKPTEVSNLLFWYIF